MLVHTLENDLDIYVGIKMENPSWYARSLMSSAFTEAFRKIRGEPPPKLRSITVRWSGTSQLYLNLHKFWESHGLELSPLSSSAGENQVMPSYDHSEIRFGVGEMLDFSLKPLTKAHALVEEGEAGQLPIREEISQNQPGRNQPSKIYFDKLSIQIASRGKDGRPESVVRASYQEARSPPCNLFISREGIILYIYWLEGTQGLRQVMAALFVQPIPIYVLVFLRNGPIDANLAKSLSNNYRPMNGVQHSNFKIVVYEIRTRG